MPSFRTGVVNAILAERDGLQRVEVDGERAYVLTRLTGEVRQGDEVVVNTTAVDLGLGTGGWHVVHWNLSRRQVQAPGGGHVMKMRYTSLQTDVGAAEESGDLPSALDGTPVVVCTVHSQVACVAAAFRAVAPAGARLVYVMTDGGALPLALSELVADLRRVGLLDATVTAGNAFGGDLEAVGVHSGLAVARHVAGAAAVVVGMGPGVVGTASGLGTTALEAAPALDAAAALGGRPILAVRASAADPRERHQGVSHHTLAVLDLVRSAVTVPMPGGSALAAPPGGRHRSLILKVPDVGALLAERGLRVTSMGRGPDEDPLFFAAAGAAGVAAARSLTPGPVPSH